MSSRRAFIVFFRNVIAIWIPLAVAVASLTVVPRWRAAGLMLVAITCGAFLYYDHAIATTKQIQRDDWRHIALVLGRPNEARVVVVTPWVQETPLAWYEPCLRRTRAPQAVRVVDWVGYYDLPHGHAQEEWVDRGDPVPSFPVHACSPDGSTQERSEPVAGVSRAAPDWPRAAGGRPVRVGR